MPKPRFEWYKDKAGKFRFRLVAPNGQTIAASEAYETKDALARALSCQPYLIKNDTKHYI